MQHRIMTPDQAAHIPIYDRAGEVVAYTVIDESDRSLAEQHRWHLNKGYARSGKVDLHRLILGPSPGKHVDHINRDKLDNRRSNLRAIDPGENSQNRGRWPSKRRFRNVELDRRRKVLRWRVNPRIDGRNVHVGYYATEFEAAIVAEAWRGEHTPYAPKDPVFLHFVDVGLDEAA